MFIWDTNRYQLFEQLTCTRIHVGVTNLCVHRLKVFPCGWCYGVAINIPFYLILIFRMLLSVKPFVSMRCDGEHLSNEAGVRTGARECVTNFNFNI